MIVMHEREAFTAQFLEDLEGYYLNFFGLPAWLGFHQDILEKPGIRCFILRGDSGEVIAFRLGYDTGCYVFRSWMTAVSPEHRRQGAATRLTLESNKVLVSLGYRRVKASMTPKMVALFAKLGHKLRVDHNGEHTYELAASL